MPDEINNRLLKAEWEISALKEGHRQQGDRMAEISDRMDQHHREQMGAIAQLREHRTREQGAAEARLEDAKTMQRRLKWLSFILGFLGLCATLGLIGEAKAITPIATQNYGRDVG